MHSAVSIITRRMDLRAAPHTWKNQIILHVIEIIGRKIGEDSNLIKHKLNNLDPTLPFDTNDTQNLMRGELPKKNT